MYLKPLLLATIVASVTAAPASPASTNSGNMTTAGISDICGLLASGAMEKAIGAISGALVTDERDHMAQCLVDLRDDTKRDCGYKPHRSVAGPCICCSLMGAQISPATAAGDSNNVDNVFDKAIKSIRESNSKWRNIYKRVSKEGDPDYMQGVAVSCGGKWADKICNDWRTGSVSNGDWEFVDPVWIKTPILAPPPACGPDHGYATRHPRLKQPVFCFRFFDKAEHVIASNSMSSRCNSVLEIKPKFILKHLVNTLDKE